MKILVTGATTTVARIARSVLGSRFLGHLHTPQAGNDLQMLLRSGLYWACDNSAYSDWCPVKFRAMTMDVWQWLTFNPPAWVAVPDVVPDHEKTLLQFNLWCDEWEYEIGYVPWPMAFVLQNGATIDSIPWDRIVAVFVGGDDDFKLKNCHELVEAAKEREKIVHVGRVNSLKRIRYAYELGADTIDGTQFSKWANAKIYRALQEIKTLVDSPKLIGH